MPSDITQYLLWILHQPASKWSLSLSSTDLYAAANQHEFHTSDTQGLIASELEVQFAKNEWKKPFHISRFYEREITAGKHPSTSLLSSHLKKHVLHLVLVTTEISIKITIEFWKALGQYLLCTSMQRNREETQSSVNSTTNSYISLCEQQEERLVLFFSV